MELQENPASSSTTSRCEEDSQVDQHDEPEEGKKSGEKPRMEEIIPKLFIGDLTAALSRESLEGKKIRNVVVVMKQSYPHHPSFNYLLVPVDDTFKTNICEWFDIVANWVQDRLDDVDNYGVLIHCIAGVSRSATLLAAYLMKALKLTTEEALVRISAKRPQIEPNEFFIHQLEMYERCNCEWNPVKYQEQRRFVMNFMADDINNGVGPEKLILADYPSPAPSPKEGSMSMAMTTMKATSVEDELRSKGQRLRCKMCRRELAAGEHILVHSPGKGQSAFAPQKQDMSMFRQHQVAPYPRTGTENYPTKVNQGVLGNLRISVPPHLKIHDTPSSSTITTDDPTPSSTQLRGLSIISPTSSGRFKIKSQECSSYFVEPLSWMKLCLEKGDSMGKIICPNLRCKSKLGSFDWAGSQCSCGAWITPGFQILSSKVDEL